MRKCSNKKCGKTYPLNDINFYKNKHNKCGYDYLCKKCRRMASNEYWDRRREGEKKQREAIPDKENVEMRRCKGCQQEFQLTHKYFYKRGSGFQYTCIECVLKLNKQKRKQEYRIMKLGTENVGLVKKSIKKYKVVVGEKYKHYKKMNGRGKWAGKTRVRDCTVIQDTEEFITVQYEDYKNCILKVDIMLGLDRLEKAE